MALLRMSLVESIAIWLVACGALIVCCQPSQCLAAKSQAASSEMGSDAGEDPYLVSLLQQLEDHEQRQQHQRQQQLQQEQHARAADDNDHWQSKRLRLDEPEFDGSSNSGLNQLTPKESMRRLRLDQLLDALAGTIPSATTARPRVNSQQSSGEQNQAPIYRSGRTFPAAGDLLASGAGMGPAHQRNQQFAGRSFGARERWQSNHNNNNINSNNMLDGRASSRNANAGQFGLVWPANQDNGGGGGGGGRYTSKSRSATGNLNKVARSFAIDELDQPANELYRANEMGGSGRKSHRSGTEEFAIQTPIHSQAAGDYETKRVENSRGWNTLRGMWGKRSANGASSGDDDGRLQRPVGLLSVGEDNNNNDELGAGHLIGRATTQSIRLSM